MKKRIIYGLASTALILLSSCDESWKAGGDGSGKFNPIVLLDPNPLTSRSASRAEVPDQITAGDLNLRLTSQTSGIVNELGKFSDYDITKTHNVGTYIIEAYYGDIATEDYERPFYYGTANFTIKENESTNVSLQAKLANAMVSITYTEAFSNYYKNYSSTIKGIEYTANENRPLYVTPGKVSVKTSVTTPTGKTQEFESLNFDAVACHHYKVTIDVNDGNANNAVINVTYDDTFTEESFAIDLEDLENSPAPTITANGFENGTVFDIVKGTTITGDLNCTIIAQAGLSSIQMTTTASNNVLPNGWPTEVDLLSADAAVQSKLTTAGFKEIGLWNNPDKMALIDLKNVLSNLAYTDGQEENSATFTLVATDKLSRSTEAISFTVNVDKMTITLSNPSTLYVNETTATVDIDFNGDASIDMLGVEYFDTEYGVWNEAAIDNIAEISRAGHSYRITVSNLPATDKDTKIRPTYEGMAYNEITITRGGAALSVADYKIYATHATIDVIASSKVTSLDGAVLEMSTNNGSYQEYNYIADGVKGISLSNLNPGTTYTARLVLDGKSAGTINFTTETAAQLPNADMEDWYTQKGKSDYQIWNYPFSNGGQQFWNTYNPVTMSQEASGTGGYAYKATSGTVGTSDAHNGKNAAQIRTVGWGSGNTAHSNAFKTRFEAFATCKHVSSGQLFLGNWDGIEIVQNAIPNYGIGFNSRPSSISFWYKYAVMNSSGKNNGEKGVGIVQILDANNKVIVEQELLLNINASYANLSADTDYSLNGNFEQKTSSFNYPSDAPKAAKIVVIFKSSQLSNSELENNKNKDYMRPPKPLNLSNHEYLGASLIIDDITLNY